MKRVRRRPGTPTPNKDGKDRRNIAGPSGPPRDVPGPSRSKNNPGPSRSPRNNPGPWKNPSSSTSLADESDDNTIDMIHSDEFLRAATESIRRQTNSDEDFWYSTDSSVSSAEFESSGDYDSEEISFIETSRKAILDDELDFTTPVLTSTKYIESYKENSTDEWVTNSSSDDAPTTWVPDIPEIPIPEMNISNFSLIQDHGEIVDIPLPERDNVESLEIQNDGHVAEIPLPEIDNVEASEIQDNGHFEEFPLPEIDNVESPEIQDNGHFVEFPLPEIDNVEAPEIQDNGHFVEFPLPEIDNVEAPEIQDNGHFEEFPLPKIDNVEAPEIQDNGHFVEFPLPEIDNVEASETEDNGHVSEIPFPERDILKASQISGKSGTFHSISDTSSLSDGGFIDECITERQSAKDNCPVTEIPLPEMKEVSQTKDNGPVTEIPLLEREEVPQSEDLMLPVVNEDNEEAEENNLQGEDLMLPVVNEDNEKAEENNLQGEDLMLPVVNEDNEEAEENNLQGEDLMLPVVNEDNEEAGVNNLQGDDLMLPVVNEDNAEVEENNLQGEDILPVVNKETEKKIVQISRKRSTLHSNSDTLVSGGNMIVKRQSVSRKRTFHSKSDKSVSGEGLIAKRKPVSRKRSAFHSNSDTSVSGGNLIVKRQSVSRKRTFHSNSDKSMSGKSLIAKRKPVSRRRSTFHSNSDTSVSEESVIAKRKPVSRRRSTFHSNSDTSVSGESVIAKRKPVSRKRSTFHSNSNKSVSGASVIAKRKPVSRKRSTLHPNSDTSGSGGSLVAERHSDVYLDGLSMISDISDSARKSYGFKNPENKRGFRFNESLSPQSEIEQSKQKKRICSAKKRRKHISKGVNLNEWEISALTDYEHSDVFVNPEETGCIDLNATLCNLSEKEIEMPRQAERSHSTKNRSNLTGVNLDEWEISALSDSKCTGIVRNPGETGYVDNAALSNLSEGETGLPEQLKRVHPTKKRNKLIGEDSLLSVVNEEAEENDLQDIQNTEEKRKKNTDWTEDQNLPSYDSSKPAPITTAELQRMINSGEDTSQYICPIYFLRQKFLAEPSKPIGRKKLFKYHVPAQSNK